MTGFDCDFQIFMLTFLVRPRVPVLLLKILICPGGNRFVLILQCIFYFFSLYADVFLRNGCTGMLQELTHKLDVISVV